jgi:hypothetical protein
MARRSAAMPVLAFFAVAGSVLIALLFLADATLEKNDSPVIVTSQRSGLPEPPRHRDEIHILITTPTPAPDMTSPAVLAAQPKSEPDALAKIHPEARAARAEAPPENKRVTQSIDHEQNHNRENQSFDKFSIKGQ